MKLIGKALLSFFIGGVALLFLLPQVGYAVDFSITDVRIDALLQENGQVEVTETHTYEFDSEFNGITREIVPKDGTKILDLQAYENGKALKIEKDNDLYKIHRKGENESITIDIQYVIDNGVHVYQDVAEFYWPFFDKRNESTYEKMNITIYPPKETRDVIAFGYNEAFQREKVLADGAVLFQLGEVPDGKNGDIRVAYDAALFPAAPLTADVVMKDKIINAEQTLLDAAAARAEKRETLAKIAIVVVPLFALFFFIFVFRIILSRKMKKRELEQALRKSTLIPEENISLPGTILFTAGMSLHPAEAMSASLLDLVRKGFIQKGTEGEFQLVDGIQPQHKHEKLLLQFLFTEVGTGKEFSFDDLKAYTTKTKNHEKFQTNMMKWQQALREELKEKKLFNKNGKVRISLLIAGLLLIPFNILFASYELFGWFASALILTLAYFVLAATYITKSEEGLKISQEWGLMGKRLQHLPLENWKQLSEQDQMRAYIYGLGTNNKSIVEKNKEFIQLFNRPLSMSDMNAVNLNSLILMGPLISSNFHSAHDTTQSSTSSSSSSSTGGGVGGGGGGSGAF